MSRTGWGQGPEAGIPAHSPGADEDEGDEDYERVDDMDWDQAQVRLVRDGAAPLMHEILPADVGVGDGGTYGWDERGEA